MEEEGIFGYIFDINALYFYTKNINLMRLFNFDLDELDYSNLYLNLIFYSKLPGENIKSIGNN